MRAKEVTYERKFNLGNYETETISLTVELEDGEKFSEVLGMARKAVLAQGAAIPRAQSSAAKDLQTLLDTKQTPSA